MLNDRIIDEEEVLELRQEGGGETGGWGRRADVRGDPEGRLFSENVWRGGSSVPDSLLPLSYLSFNRSQPSQKVGYS